MTRLVIPRVPKSPNAQFVSKAEFQRALAGKGSGRRQHVPGQMNKREAAYATDLERWKRFGTIRDWAFEAIKLRLAKATFYTPDFVVVNLDGTIELHECKGHIEDDWRVKWKVAQEKFPYFRFVEVR